MSPEQAKAWQNRTETEWRLWAEKKQCCDAIGVSNFDELQELAIKSALMSGDCFALLLRDSPSAFYPYGLRIKLLEADLVSTPGDAGSLPVGITEGIAKNGNYIYDGVEVDKDTSAIVAYHICNHYPFELVRVGNPKKWARVEAYGKITGLPNVLQIMKPERAGQYRGVTFLAPVIEQLLQIRRYTEAELAGALVQAMFTAWIETSADPAAFPLNEIGGDEQEVSHDPNEYEMGPGLVIHLRPGENVKFGNPNIPTNGFDNFVKSMAMQVGAALQIPKDVLLKEFTKSYSASRGALLEAYKVIKKHRKWLVDDFCQPVYEAWLAEAVARGRVNAPGFFSDPLIRAAYCGTQWIGPSQGLLDPIKEVKAAILSVEHGFKTHEQATVEFDGGDWEENLVQLAREVAGLEKIGGTKTDFANENEESDDENGGDE
jgi:lambda family phage portal protein